MNNEFSMDNIDMEKAVMTFNNAGVQHEQAISTLSSSFNDIKQTGLFANGLNKISKQLDTLYETSSSLKSVMQKQTEDTFTMEMMLKSKAEEIEITDYFVTNNAANIIETKAINVDKQDGKSVNEGSSGEVNTELNDSMVRKENLQSIEKDTPNASSTNIDIAVENENVGLKNINNDDETTEASFEALVDGQEVNLSNIKNQDSTKEASVKIDSEVTKIDEESLAIKNNNGNDHNDSDTRDINYKDNAYANNLTSMNNQASETNEVNYTNNSNITDQVDLNNQANNSPSNQLDLNNQMNNNLTNQVNLNNQSNNNPSNQLSINNQTNNNFSSQINLNNQSNNSSLNMNSFSSSSSSNYNFENDKDEKEKKSDESNNYNFNYNSSIHSHNEEEKDEDDDDDND